MTDEDAPRPNDKTAPIAGAALTDVDERSFIEILERLPPRKRASYATFIEKGKPSQLAASKQKRRDRFRMAFSILLVLGIVGEALIALYITEVSKTQSWDTMKDWLVLALAPLIAAAAVAAAFWFPSKEVD